MKVWLALPLLILIGCATAPPPQADPIDLVIVRATVLDPETGVLTPDRAVLIEDGRVLDIVATRSAPAARQTVDVEGGVLLPGFVDAHVHLREADESALLDYLRAGVTTVRDMNGRPGLLAWRDQIEAGTRAGPRMVVGSPTIANLSSPRQGFPTPTNADEAAAMVDRFRAEGYDFIKIYTFLPPDAFRGVADHSLSREFRFAGHAPIGVPFEDLLGSGLWSLEHLTGFAEAVATDASASADAEDNRGVFQAVEIDPARMARYARMALENGVWTVATLTYWDTTPPPGPAREAWNDPELRRLGHRSRRAMLKGLHDAGAPIAVGTDSDAGDDIAATAYWDELAAMVDAGLPPRAVIQAATIGGADMLRLPDLGRMSRGAIADLVVLRCDPIADMTCARQPVWVIRQGEVVVRPAP